MIRGRPERIDGGERGLRDELERLQVEVRRVRELESELEATRRERDELAAKLSWHEQQDSGRAISELFKQVENLEKALALAQEKLRSWQNPRPSWRWLAGWAIVSLSFLLWTTFH